MPNDERKTVARVRNRMAKGACLARLNVNHKTLLTPLGTEWFLIPGGPIAEGVARHIIAMPDVAGGKDSLFPGLDQTYRMVRISPKKKAARLSRPGGANAQSTAT